MDPAVLERLRGVPLPVFAKEALKIANKDGEVVPLDIAQRPGQIKLAAAIKRQEDAGVAVRIILVKSRQFGGSTLIQAYLGKKAVTTARRRMLTVAQKLRTAEGLFGMQDLMYQRLPDNMRPELAGYANPTRGEKIMHFGEKLGGFVSGLDSKVSIDTAEEVGGGRGLTFTDLHLTECAHWRDARKALDLLPAVPKRPGTSIFLESTANGLNWFHKRFKMAMEGLSEFEAVFVGWWEDPDCVRQFPNADARAEFVASIGDERLAGGPWADEEPWLVEEFGCTPEQLYFRRTAIVDECEGKVELFKQEYPATWSEAFIGSGRQVFSVVYTQQAIRQAERWTEKAPADGGPQRGIFQGLDPITRTLSDGTVQVPQRVIWLPEAEIPARCEWWPGQFHESRDPLWTLWLPRSRWPGEEWSPERWREAHEAGDIDLEDMESGMARALLGPGQYILTGDPADDVENNSPSEREEHAFNALSAIDHHTGEQIAEWQARTDHDLVARQAYLCGTFLNGALVSIERTGGYGISILNDLKRRFYYKWLFTEKVIDDKSQRETQRYGWDTNRRTKPSMEATMQALLREGTHGFKSLIMAGQLVTYIKNDKGQHEPSPGSFSDLLMTSMQGQEIRRLRRPRPAPTTGARRPNSMVRKMPW
jgi:hypothetical protein